jgi:histone-lysine N-methyltransferase SETMAR
VKEIIIAKLTEQTIEQFGWEVLPHPSWSSDFAPSDYHFFLSLRNYLCDKHYEDFDELNSDLTACFESKSTSFYRRGIEVLLARWTQVIENNVDYVAH